jgi:hypothetical protein
MNFETIMTFTINRRVRIRESAMEFGGVTGSIAFPPAGIEEIDQEWIGPFKYEKQRKGVVLLYWVKFDEPADDGSGDGPYWGCGIGEDDLEPIE